MVIDCTLWYLVDVQIEALWGQRVRIRWRSDGDALQSRLQSRQLCGRHSGIMEPGHYFIVGQQYRHPVMDMDDGIIGCSG